MNSKVMPIIIKWLLASFFRLRRCYEIFCVFIYHIIYISYTPYFSSQFRKVVAIPLHIIAFTWVYSAQSICVNNTMKKFLLPTFVELKIKITKCVINWFTWFKIQERAFIQLTDGLGFLFVCQSVPSVYACSFYSLEDFSDYKEEDEEDEDDVGETIIVKGVQGECKDNGEGKYRYVWLYVCMSVCIC